MEESLDVARGFAFASGGSFAVADSMEAAFEDADIVYPKSWAPIHVMHERTRLIRAGDRARLVDLEREALVHNARYQSWECTDALMQRTREGRALYMHCLPADVTGVSCAAGEVSRDVFERASTRIVRPATSRSSLPR